MLGDAAKGAAAKAAAHDVDTETDHLPRGDFGDAVMAAVLVCIGRVRTARIRQVKHMVHLGGGQRNGRRVDPHIAGGAALAVRLYECAGVAGVGLQVQHAVGVGVKHGIRLDLLVAGQADHAALTRGLRRFGCTQCWVGDEVQGLELTCSC